MASTILTFDLGTTFIKAAIFSENHRLLALARAPLPTTHPHPGWHEVSVHDFRAAIITLAHQLHGQNPREFAAVARISFATQTNSFVLLDDQDQPLTPIILWTDRRAQPVAPIISTLSQRPEFYLQTGLPEWDSQFMPAKLHWLREHQPELFQRANKLFLIGDYLTYWLTGQHVTEAGAAGLTGLIDIHQLQWRQPVIETLNLHHIRRPQIQRAGTPVGNILPHTADQLHLPHKLRVYLGCLDQYAGAIAAGNIRPGVVSETTGTALASVTLSDQFDPALQTSGVYQGPSFREGYYYRMMVSDISAHLLETYYRSSASQHTWDELNQLAEQVNPATNPVSLDIAASRREGKPIFIGTPANNPHGHHILAIYQAISDALADQVRHLCPQKKPSQIFCLGGAARSRLLRKLKADKINATAAVVDSPEPTSLGAALLTGEVDTWR